ncbi:MAG: hypothetical protein MK110_17790 [Fuerstiella sp.]|nr:hypothetical protein [Fuerstiella sp.]
MNAQPLLCVFENWSADLCINQQLNSDGGCIDASGIRLPGDYEPIHVVFGCFYCYVVSRILIKF